MSVLSTDLKKGEKLILTGNREAILQCKVPKTRPIVQMVEVLGTNGNFHEWGSCYVNEILNVVRDEKWVRVEMTPQQKKAVDSNPFANGSW
jgi:hypothetical protein